MHHPLADSGSTMSTNAMRRLLDALFQPARLRRIAVMWLLATAIGVVAHLCLQTRAGLTDGAGHPFGDDAITFWSGGRLALLGRAREVYDFGAFHRFEVAVLGHEIDLYNYAYPPPLLLLTLPLGLLPFLAGIVIWLIGGWLVFALCVRRLLPKYWLLYAAALPAVFINALSGQNGPWTAAIIGWGLVLLRERPLLSGGILSLLAFKPQLGALIPVALVAGRCWRVLAGLLAGGLVFGGAVWAAFGTLIWADYLVRARILEVLVMERGEGIWHRMFSVFVLLRHLGATVKTAYEVQAAVSFTAVLTVILVWSRPVPQPAKNATLVLCALLATPYVTDYDLVMAGLVPLWLFQLVREGTADVTQARIASLLVIAAPAVAAPLALETGAAAAGLFLLPALWLAASGSLPGSRRSVLPQ